MNDKMGYAFRVESGDRELQAIEVMMSVLCGLDNIQRARVLAYVADRFVEGE